MTISNNHLYKHIKYEKYNKIGLVTLSEAKLSVSVLNELTDLVQKIAQEDALTTSGLIISGGGERYFCAGNDIGEISEMTGEEAYDFGKLGQNLTLLLEKLSIPVIAAVNGVALGGGLEIALSSDFILATNNSHFGLTEASLGLIPAFGGTQRLAKYLGRNRAKEIIYTGRIIDADEAFETGLVLAIYETEDDLLDASISLIKEIEKNSPVAVSFVKSVMNEGNDKSLEEGLDLELEKFSAIFTTRDMKEGTKAFLAGQEFDFRQ